jgi:glutamyl-tRNA reductase
VLKNIDEQSILFAVGINYKTAAIGVREKFYIQDEEMPALVATLKETLTECVVLSTCNRTEIYGVTSRSDLDLGFYKDLLIDFKNAREIVSHEDFFGLVACAACQHLFQVATSIESKIVGDMQILEQVRNAYEISKKNKLTGKILNQMFQRGFKIGKQVRTSTNLHKGAVSVSLAAVELASETFGSLADKNVLIIGAGETARLTAECLIKKRVGKISITNRTKAHADELLASLQAEHDFSGEVINFNDFKNHLNETDIVISSTSAPEPILYRKDFTGQTRKILLIDIAVPRDIHTDAALCANVLLKNIDDLHAIVDKNYQRRMNDLPLVKHIMMTEMSDFLVWYYSLPFIPNDLQAGAKPDKELQIEIVKVKNFLLKNASYLHRLVQQNGADNFAGHFSVINKLAEMKEAEFAGS